MNFDKDIAIKELNKNALDVQKISRYGMGKCARYVRAAIDAGFGFPNTLFNQERSVFFKNGAVPASAKMYGENLLSVGFSLKHSLTIELNYYLFRGDKRLFKDYPAPSRGDIAVLKNSNSLHGHICMYNGTSWVSDFTQNDICGGNKFRTKGTSIMLYNA